MDGRDCSGTAKTALVPDTSGDSSWTLQKLVLATVPSPSSYANLKFQERQATAPPKRRHPAMFNWAKQQLANVAGTEEPVYGPSAIQTVTDQAKSTPYTELHKGDLKWALKDGTCVETQTFYFTADSGHIGMAQIIYSNVAGIRKTTQFNSKIIYPGQTKPNLWTSDPLDSYSFEDSNLSFRAPNVSVTLSADGSTYTIKSTVNKSSVVDITVSRSAPGFVAGSNGVSSFGTNPAQPWGTMRHAFWPRCNVTGSIITQSGPVDLKGRGTFIHALQGMKPHHAAAQWTFANFHGPTYSAVLMQFTTPPSYGSTTVSVGGVVTDGQILFAGASNSAKFTKSTLDPQTQWREPSAYEFEWYGAGEGDRAVLQGEYGPRVDRVDVMAEVPAFVKAIVANAAGTKPYIYQFMPETELVLMRDGEEKRERGILFSEATFISGAP